MIALGALVAIVTGAALDAPPGLLALLALVGIAACGVSVVRGDRRGLE